MVADNPLRKKLLVSECKWRNDFDESDAVRKLEERAKLIGDYESVAYAVFSKRGVSEATRRKLAGNGNWMLVDADDLYRGI